MTPPIINKKTNYNNYKHHLQIKEYSKNYKDTFYIPNFYHHPYTQFYCKHETSWNTYN